MFIEPKKSFQLCQNNVQKNQLLISRKFEVNTGFPQKFQKRNLGKKKQKSREKLLKNFVKN